MNVIKRSGEEVEFNAEKIENAIKKANEATDQSKELLRIRSMRLRSVSLRSAAM